MRIAAFVALVTAVAACTDQPPGAPTTPPPTTGVVQATPAIAFQPPRVEIRVNGTITWAFGAVPHNVIFAATAGRPADIPGFNQNTSVARTFTAAGTFPYECTIHPGMRGTVVVTPDNPASPYLAARPVTPRRALVEEEARNRMDVVP
ncbi:MAG: cupredoxin domain-containing protein [Burkholderiales bacterium]